MEINTDKLIEIIINKGLTFSELSEKTGLTNTVISRLVNKKTKKANIKTISKIVKALDIKFEDIK